MDLHPLLGMEEDVTIKDEKNAKVLKILLSDQSWKQGFLSLDNWEVSRAVMLYSSLKGGCSEVDVGPFSQLTRDKMRGNGLQLCKAKISWNYR